MVLLINDEPEHVNYSASRRRDKVILKRNGQDMYHHAAIDQQREEINYPTLPNRNSFAGRVIKSNRTRKIRFSPQCQIMSTICWRDMSRNNHEAIWYQKEEYESIKVENNILKSFPKQRFVEDYPRDVDTLHSARGIEKLIDPEYHSEKKRNKRILIDAVKIEQARQRMLRINDPLLISDVSETFTRISREIALKRAREDAEFVRMFGSDEYHIDQIADRENDSSVANVSVAQLAEAFESPTRRIPSRPTRKSNCLEMRMVECQLTPTGVDIEMIDNTCPHTALHDPNNIDIDFPPTSTRSRDEKRKNIIEELLDHYTRCGEGYRFSDRWRKPKRAFRHMKHPACIIYDADGRRLWTQQNHQAV